MNYQQRVIVLFNDLKNLSPSVRYWKDLREVKEESVLFILEREMTPMYAFNTLNITLHHALKSYSILKHTMLYRLYSIVKSIKYNEPGQNLIDLKTPSLHENKLLLL